MLDKTGLSLRERSGFEALDAGLLLFRRHFLSIQASWLGFYIPVLILMVSLPSSLVWIPAVALWWFRPLLDRIILRRVAHIFFNAGGKPKWKGIFRGLFSDLTWRRFSVFRYYSQPVRALEGIRGVRLKKRVSFIFGEYRGVAFALGAVVILLEFSLLSGISAFVMNMTQFIPHALRTDLTWETPWIARGLMIGWGLIATFTIPAGVCMGFSLYINRRVILEGWDLEVAFTRTARRMKSITSTLLLMLFIGLGPGVNEIHAESETPMESLEEILADDDFGSVRERSAWRWKNQNNSNNSTDNNFDDLFGNGSITMASVLRILVISAAVLAISLIIWKNRKVLFRRLSDSGSRYEKNSWKPARAVKDKVETLPLESSVELYEAGRFREAWSVLYRHLTELLSRETGNPPGDEATEGEWLKYLAKPETNSNDQFKDDARRIISAWRQAAYAHMEPGRDLFTDCYAILCRLKPTEKKTA